MHRVRLAEWWWRRRSRTRPASHFSRGSEGANNDNTLTDDLSGVVKYESHGTHRKLLRLQLQGAIGAMMVARGMTPPAAISDEEQQLRQRLDEKRGNLHALQESQWWVDAEEAMVHAIHGGAGGAVQHKRMIIR